MSEPRKRLVRFATILLPLAGALTACAVDPSPPIETVASGGAIVVSSESGALTAPSTASPETVVRDYLRARGAGVATLRLERELPGRAGISHLRFEQVVDGRRVVGAYVKAAVSERGELVHLIERLAPVVPYAEPTVAERAALEAALAHLGYATPTPVEVERRGKLTRFSAGKLFHRAPSVERVIFLADDGSAAAGFLVETWTARDNLLDYTIVDGRGAVVSVERRTNNDSYAIYTEDPLKGGQTTVAGGAGWLGSGSQWSTYISGNNARAYLDLNADNVADTGVGPVSDGNFLAPSDLASAPSTTNNRAVAVQNLFYLNNVVHDALYLVGFNEAAGNFQANNFGLGGAGNDPVSAEAQDGSGTDNANFSTPPDGSAPRMQMYLWSSLNPNAQATVGAGTYDGYGASFGPALTAGGITGALAAVADKKAPFGDGCTANNGSLAGKVAIVDRGKCDFTVKVKNAQLAGAVAVIVHNNEPGAAFSMAGTDPSVTIPSMMVSQAQGNALRALLGQSAKVALHPVPANMIDGDIDSDIVFHEYGHGLTWRMIGGMSGALSGAIGEGASDVLAFLMNCGDLSSCDDRVGEYSSSTPGGIRRAPYATYPNTYGDVTGTEVHDDGEPYAAAMYAVLEQYQGAGLTANDLLGDFVQGMNFTPAGPFYEHMRDGMLQAATVDRHCLIWRGFAEFGVGVGASGSNGRRLRINESFAVPAGCN